MTDFSVWGEPNPLAFQSSGAFDSSPFNVPDWHGRLSLLEPVLGESWRLSLDALQDFVVSDRTASLAAVFGGNALAAHSIPIATGEAPLDQPRGPQRQDSLSQMVQQQIFDLLSDQEAEPGLEVLPVAQLSARGAFSAEQNTIYVSDAFIADNADDPEAIAAVLLEELGHFIDAQINESDTPGDEGQLFSALVRDQPLTPEFVEAIAAEDDGGWLNLGGRTVAVEYSDGPSGDLPSGEFQVDASGQVQIELLFDGGDFSGELAVFRLDGLEDFEPGSAAYIREAARRALSNSSEGHIVISDRGSARFAGDIDEVLLPTSAATPSRFEMVPGDRIAFFLVPNGTVQELLEDPAVDDDELRPLFSIAAANPGGLEQFSLLSDGVFAVEDLRRDRVSDSDFEDFIFSFQGGSGQLEATADLVAPDVTWIDGPSTSILAESILAETPMIPVEESLPMEEPRELLMSPPVLPEPVVLPEPAVLPESSISTPEFSEPVVEETSGELLETPEMQDGSGMMVSEPEVMEPEPDVMESEPEPEPEMVEPPETMESEPEPDVMEPEPEPDVMEPEPEPEMMEPEPEPEPAPLPAVPLTAVSGEFFEFGPDITEAELMALGAPSLTLGTQTIYIGTQQVSSINQNPIVRSFDPVNPANNWTRTDYEVTGTDGRGIGLFWSGTDLYAVFTVDGTQGTPDQDFRRAAGDAEQSWLRSYGAGGGAQISVLGRIDPRTGALLDAAHLSAVLSNGNSNTLRVNDVQLNGSGNLVVSADVFFRPRNPDGSAMRQVVSGSSPFDHTLEITPDLERVVNTSTVGWVPV